MALAKEFLLDGDISLKEKYLSFDNEKRIRRMQFFERMLIPGLLLTLFLFLPSVIVGAIFAPENVLKWGVYVNVIFQLIYLAVVMKYYPVIIKKRAQDFGKEGKTETMILIGGTILATIIGIYSQYLLSIMDIQGILDISKYSSILNIVLSILWLYLLFRPGTKGKNEYGEQKYYRLKFLG